MIKVAQSTYKLANKRGILPQYLTWCRLKSLTPQGTIGRGREEMMEVAKRLQVSESNLRSHLTRLVKEGLVRRHKFSYSLVSYDRGWELLGVDTQYNPNTNRKGRFSILKTNDVENLKEQIEFYEIKLHVQKEAFNAKKSLLKSGKLSDAEKNTLRKTKFVDLTNHLDDINTRRLSVVEGVKEYLSEVTSIEYGKKKGVVSKYTKITPFITCEKTATLLGYQPSPNTGQAIRKRIEKVGLAKFIKRDIAFTSDYKWKTLIEVNRLENQYPSRIKDVGGKGYCRIISKMVIM